MADEDHQPESAIRMRRYPLAEAAAGGHSAMADIERVFDTYGIRNFEYRVWGRWTGGLPSGLDGTLRTGEVDDTMRNNRGNTAGGKAGQALGSYGWEMPDDLRSGGLPLLQRMSDTSSLVARLKLEGGPVVSIGDGNRDLPELRETAQEIHAEEPSASRPAKAGPSPAAQASTEKQPSGDARSRLRRLALKGQTHG